VCAPYLPPAKKGPTTPSRQCQGCKKHVRGNNFTSGSIADGLWNCARCLHEKTRTQCVECGGVCAITLPRCYNCWDAAREKHPDRQGRCEGTTLAGRRCNNNFSFHPRSRGPPHDTHSCAAPHVGPCSGPVPGVDPKRAHCMAWLHPRNCLNP
jgi:hypothetical protein